MGMKSEGEVTIANLPPEVIQRIIRQLESKDLLNCRLVSTIIKLQTDQVIGFKNQEDEDPNLIWNPKHTTHLACKSKELFQVQIPPGTTILKKQKQLRKFLQYATKLPQGTSPFQNSALIYRAASRMRIPLCSNNRDLFVVFDRPVLGLKSLLSLYGSHLTSFVFDCKNQSFYQFLTPENFKQILKHLPNLTFLGINVPFKEGLFERARPSRRPIDNENTNEQDELFLQEPREPVLQPKLPNLKAISLGLATTAVCCRGYGEDLLSWETILGAYGNQIKMLTIGENWGNHELTELYDKFLCCDEFEVEEEEPSTNVSFRMLENLKVFNCHAPFELLRNIAFCPSYRFRNLKRLSLELRNCTCTSKFKCSLASWSKCAANIIMRLMTRFSKTLEELYADVVERDVDVLHWIRPCFYEWHAERDEEYEVFVDGGKWECKKLKKIALPANRMGSRVMRVILKRCINLEEISFLRGEGKGELECEEKIEKLNLDFPSLVKEIMAEICPSVRKVTVLKDLYEFEYLYKSIKSDVISK